MARRTDGLRLIVGAVPVLAEGWLLPRLPGFTARQPGCSLHLQVFPTLLYMEDMPFDVGVQYDDAVEAGAETVIRRWAELKSVIAALSEWSADA